MELKFKTVDGVPVTAWQWMQLLVDNENRLMLARQNNQRQQEFLQASIESEGLHRGVYPPKENTSAYLADLLGEVSEPGAKCDILLTELTRVRNVGAELEAQLVKTRKELADVRREHEKIREANGYAATPQIDAKAAALMKRKNVILAREKPPLEKQREIAKSRLEILAAARSRLEGERIDIQSEWLDGLLFCPEGQKLARLDAESEKQRESLKDAAQRLAALENELETVVADARRLVWDELNRRQQRMADLLLEAEGHSVWCDWAATLWPGRPELRGSSFFAGAETQGGSRYRHELLDKMNRGITAARRAS